MMPDPLISLVHITARIDPPSPLWWKRAANQWAANCDRPEQIEYVLAIHHSRIGAFYSELANDIPAEFRYRATVNNRGLDSPAAQINYGFQRAQGQVLIGVMDDIFPPPHWDTLILEALTILDAPLILNCESGFPHKLINAGAMTRAYYEQDEYVMHPDYEQYYACCDREFSEVAYQRKQVIEKFDIVFDHQHPSLGKGEWDEVYRQHHNPEMQRLSQEVYEKRRAAGFPKGSVL